MLSESAMMDVSSPLLKKRVGNTIVAAYLLLEQNDLICLLLRKNTGYCDGMYGLISGHVEDGESATTAMIREAEEEAGLKLIPSQLKVVHILHRKTDRLCVDFFFKCTSWKGSIKNQEPEKCEKLEFFPLNALPSNTIEYIVDVIHDVSKGQIFSEKGWDI
jgi:8-oxo-dGTP pyrophosphatase MutT (NUDIX family)